MGKHLMNASEMHPALDASNPRHVFKSRKTWRANLTKPDIPNR